MKYKISISGNLVNKQKSEVVVFPDARSLNVSATDKNICVTLGTSVPKSDRWFLLLLLLWTTVAEGWAKEAILGSHGRSEYAIVLSAEASASERLAARELEHFLNMGCGTSIPIVEEKSARAAQPARIFIGRGRVADALIAAGGPVDWAPLEKHGEGFLIRTAVGCEGKTDLIIAGARKRGTLFGVYTLLDRLGFRWYTNRHTWFKQGDHLFVIDRADGKAPLLTLKIPMLSITERPKFDYRYPYIAEAHDKDWAARNRTNGALDDERGGSVRMQCHHTFERLIPTSLFKEHPEFFPLIGGKRVTGYVQRCLTAPGLVELTAKNMIDWMNSAPDQTYFALGQNDYANYCQCPVCSQIAEAEGSQSGLYLDFVNKVAELVEKRHPDKFLVTFAYDFTRQPPRTVKPRPNVYIQLAPIGICVAHPFPLCTEKNSREMYEILKGWAQKTDRISVWHYCTDFRHLLMPFPDFEELIPDIRTYYENGVRGIFFQGSNYGPGGSEADLRAWVLARLLWDPDQDGRQLTDEFLRAVYGPAYRPMKEYFDLIHSRVTDAGNHLHIFDPVTRKLWPQEVIEKMNRLHREALEVAKGAEPATYYLKKSRLAVRYIDFLLNSGELQSVEGKYKPVGNVKTLWDWETLAADCREFGVVELREESRDANLMHMLRQRVESHDLAVIENPELRLEAVPELGGRIVGLIHKKTGINILHNLDSTDNFYPVAGGYNESTAQKWAGTGFTNAYQAEIVGRTLILTQEKSATFHSHYTPNLRFRRIIRLPDSGARIEFQSSILNENTEPRIFKLLCRLYLRADPETVKTDLGKGEGSAADDVTMGTRVFAGESRPNGSIRFFNVADRFNVEWRFDPQEVVTCEQNLSLERRLVHFELHSEEKEIPPAGQIVLHHSLEIKETNSIFPKVVAGAF